MMSDFIELNCKYGNDGGQILLPKRGLSLIEGYEGYANTRVMFQGKEIDIKESYEHVKQMLLEE